jgi:hypothetical protein
MNVLNIYGEDGGEPVELPYIKKTGDTATGLIIFDAGIEVNNGTTAINGPAEFANTVLFKPSSTIFIDGSLQLTGDSFIVDTTTTEFNGATTEFNSDVVFSNTSSVEYEGATTFLGGGAELLNVTRNSQFSWPMTIENTSLNVTGSSTVNFGSGSAPNNTPVFNTYRSQVNLGDGGQGSVNVDTAVNLGGFASLNLLNADINMADDSIINQSGTRTIPNNMYSMNMIAGSQITFPDTTTQNSAYTGAGALAGTYGPVQMTVNADGKITALSNAVIPTPTNLSLNSLQIPIGGVNLASPQSGGINVQINNGALQSFSGSGAIASTLVNGNNIARKGFTITLGYNEALPLPPLVYISALKMRVTFTTYGPFSTSFGNQFFGQTSFDIDFYPSTWSQPVNASSSSYSLSNNIGGQTSYVITPNSLAPNGRQYWVYNKQFQNIFSGGLSGWLVPNDINTWTMTFYIPGDNSTNIYNYSACLQILDVTSAQQNGYDCGITVVDINS